MAKTDKKVYVLGNFLKELREKKGVSLKEVEKATGIPNAYLSQLETGARKKLPPPDRLRLIANYYNASVQELLKAAGYYESSDVKETFEQKVEKNFAHLISDPKLKYGSRIDPEDLSLDAKKFVLELYSQHVKASLLYTSPYTEGVLYNKNALKKLVWKTDDVKRDIHSEGKETFIRYRVKVICTEIKSVPPKELHYNQLVNANEKVTQMSSGEGESKIAEAGSTGYETVTLIEATDRALANAMAKIKGVDWKRQLSHLWEY